MSDDRPKVSELYPQAGNGPRRPPVSHALEQVTRDVANISPADVALYDAIAAAAAELAQGLLELGERRGSTPYDDLHRARARRVLSLVSCYGRA